MILFTRKSFITGVAQGTRTRTGSALTLPEALKICQDYHDSHHHCGKDKLKKILYTAIPDSTRRPHSSHIKDTVFQVSPPATSKDYSLWHALRLTYPNCRTLGGIAEASARSRANCPSPPSMALANVASSDASVFHAYWEDAADPAKIDRLHKYAIKIVYMARTVAGVRVRPISLPPQALSSRSTVGFQPTSRKSAMCHP